MSHNHFWRGTIISCSVAVIFIFFFFLFSPDAFAGVVQYPTEQNILLTGPNITLKVEAASQANSLTVSSTSVTVMTGASDTFVIRSDDRYDLVNDSSIAVSCPSLTSPSKLTISGAKTVVITPTTNACTIPPPASSTVPSIAVESQIVPSGTILINNGAEITQSRTVDLMLSAANAVRMRICERADFLDCAVETYQSTKQWTLLKEGDGLKAVYAVFISSIGATSPTVSDTITLITPPHPKQVPEEPKREETKPEPKKEAPPTEVKPLKLPEIPAVVTPEKKAELVQTIEVLIQQLIQQVLVLVEQAKSEGVTVEVPPTIIPRERAVEPFTLRLAFGARGDEVRQLQEFLAKDPTIYPEGRITGFFWLATREAVARFQEQYVVQGLTTGRGIVGPKTRAKLNELMKQ